MSLDRSNFEIGMASPRLKMQMAIYRYLRSSFLSEQIFNTIFCGATAFLALCYTSKSIKRKRYWRPPTIYPNIRRGAQNLPVDTPDALRRLEYNKGISSFEAELTNVTPDVGGLSRCPRVIKIWGLPGGRTVTSCWRGFCGTA